MLVETEGTTGRAVSLRMRRGLRAALAGREHGRAHLPVAQAGGPNPGDGRANDWSHGALCLQPLRMMREALSSNLASRQVDPGAGVLAIPLPPQ